MLLEHIVERYPVGYTTFTVPVPTRRFGNVTHKESGKPALVLNEVGFAVYYPTVTLSPKKEYPFVGWVMRPINNTVTGFSLFFGSVTADQGRGTTSNEGARFIIYWFLWGVFYFFLSFLKIPVHNHAPLRSPPVEDEKQAKWPVVIFSPGLAGQLTTASHMCARIASTGKIVIVMDHRDGSGVVTYPRNPVTGQKERLLYIPEATTSYGTEQRSAFRMEQLDFRKFEVYTAWDAFKKLAVDGDHSKLTSMDDVMVNWDTFHDNVDFSTVKLAGHSFGGSTHFHILSTPPEEGFAPLPISHVLFMDPWLLPFPKPGPKPIELDSKVKILILHSEEFTVHKPEYLELMLETRQFWSNPPAYTIARSTHIFFVDYMWTVPKRVRTTTYPVTRKISDLIAGFLDERFEEVLDESTIRDFSIESVEGKKGKVETQLVAEGGDLICH